MASRKKVPLVEIEYNLFQKSPGSETGYDLKIGDVLYAQKVYLIQPLYLHARSPAFSMATGGKRICGFFSTQDPGWFTGEDKKQGLLLYLRPGLGFELWKMTLPAPIMRARFYSRELSELLFDARKSATHVYHA